MLTVRRSTAVLAALVTAGLSAGLGPAAHADAPQTDTFDLTFSNVSADLCPFPVRIDSTDVGYEMNHYREDGSHTYRLHSRETDTFSTGPVGSGPSLPGEPFTVNLEGQFDPQGVPQFVQGTGVLVKVPISQGVTFMAAGRLDLLSYHLDFPFVPTNGEMRNRDAFCAYLNPDH